MTDKPTINPDTPIEKSPFPPVNESLPTPSPFAPKGEPQVVKAVSDEHRWYVVKLDLTTGEAKANMEVPTYVVGRGISQIGSYLEALCRKLYDVRFVAVRTFYEADPPAKSPDAPLSEASSTWIGQTADVVGVVKTYPAADKVIQMLLDLPDEIYKFQRVYDTAAAAHATLLSDLSFKAINTLMWPGKDSTLRVASNDKERDISVSQVIAADERMKVLSQQLDEARNDLTLARNKFESAKIVAHLLAAK